MYYSIFWQAFKYRNVIEVVRGSPQELHSILQRSTSVLQFEGSNYKHSKELCFEGIKDNQKICKVCNPSFEVIIVVLQFKTIVILLIQ